MKDIVPGLLKSILNDFHSMANEDTHIQNILQGKDDQSTFEDVSELAATIGKYAYESLKNNYTDSTLPGGILYWNIAKGTIDPLMKEVHELIVDMAVQVQLREDRKAKIGIKPIRPSYNKERVEAVVNKVTFLARTTEVTENG